MDGEREGWTDGWMVGRAGGWMDREGWTDGRTVGRSDSRTVGRSDERVDGWMERRKDGRTVGRAGGWMDGEREGRKNGRTSGWMDGWREGRTEERSDERVDGWMERGKDGRTDGRAGGWMDGEREGRKNGRTSGWMDGWREGRTEERSDERVDGQALSTILLVFVCSIELVYMYCDYSEQYDTPTITNLNKHVPILTVPPHPNGPSNGCRRVYFSVIIQFTSNTKYFPVIIPFVPIPVFYHFPCFPSSLPAHPVCDISPPPQSGWTPAPLSTKSTLTSQNCTCMKAWRGNFYFRGEQIKQRTLAYWWSAID